VSYDYRWPISTRPVSPIRSPLFGPGPSPARPGSMQARAGPARISGPGSDKKLGTVGYDTARLPLTMLSLLFCTKTCFSARLARFFRAKRVGPARLGPLRAGLGQEIEPAGLEGPAQFSNRVWRVGPKRVVLHRARAEPGGPFGHLYL
jgi:hypothetical protein